MALERDSTAGAERHSDRSHHIPLLETTVAAFIGRAERGPVNEPVPLGSSDDYRRIFGGHRSFSCLSHVVQHYFLHGGEAAVVVRVANRATRGRIDLPASGGLLSLQALQPGSRELLRVSVDYDGAISQDHFNLVVQRMSHLGSNLIEDQELHLGLSMNASDERYVVDVLDTSKLVRLGGSLPAARPDATLPAHPGQAIPYLYMTKAGSDGEELTDYDIIGSAEERTGLFALESVERFDLLCIPPPPNRDLGTTSFLAAARYCERRRALLAWDTPWAWRSADAALLGMRRSVQMSRGVFVTFPRLTMRGELERFPNGLPACGAAAGMLARNDRGGIWRPLAGADAALKGGLRPLVEVDARQVTRLHRAGMNVLRRSESGYYALHGNALLAGAGALTPVWRRLDKARLALFILASIERAADATSADASDAPSLEQRVAAFLRALYEHGALAGERPEQAFYVRSAASNDRGPSQGLRFGFALLAPDDLLEYELRRTPIGPRAHALPTEQAREHTG